MSNDLVKELTTQVVKTTSLFEIDDDFDDDRFCRVRIAAMHSGKNRNNSVFDTKVIKAAKSTFANIPILAEVVRKYDEDGNSYLDYTTHAMHVEEDFYDSSKLRMIYDERVVGLVPETNDFEIVRDEDTGTDYVYVTALLLRDYGNYVCDILEHRGGVTDVSMEINCDDISINAKDSSIIVGKMTACAITLLGADVQPGMEGANAKMFSLKTKDRQVQLIELLSELNTSLIRMSRESMTDARETKGDIMKKKFDEEIDETTAETTKAPAKKTAAETTKTPAKKTAAELAKTPAKKPVARAGKTPVKKVVEEAVTDTEETKDADVTETTDVETTSESEVFEEPKKKKRTVKKAAPVEDEEETDTAMDTATAGETVEDGDSSDNSPDDSSDDDSDNDNSDDDDDINYYSVNYTVSVEGKTRAFSVSLKDKLNALTTLVNDTYSESDGAWYDVDVFEDSKTVEFHDWWSNRHFRQAYTVKKNIYALKGDRVETFATFLTSDEQDALEQMKADFSDLSNKVKNYEDEPKKLAVLNSSEYAQIADTEEFKSLLNPEQHFSLSVGEVMSMADEILLAHAKQTQVESIPTIPEITEKPKTFRLFGNPSKRASKSSSRYGGLFNK